MVLITCQRSTWDLRSSVLLHSLLGNWKLFCQTLSFIDKTRCVNVNLTTASVLTQQTSKAKNLQHLIIVLNPLKSLVICRRSIKTKLALTVFYLWNLVSGAIMFIYLKQVFVGWIDQVMWINHHPSWLRKIVTSTRQYRSSCSWSKKILMNLDLFSCSLKDFIWGLSSSVIL